MPAERRRDLRLRPETDFTVTCVADEPAWRGSPYNLARGIVDLGPRGARLVTVGRLREHLPVVVDVTAPDGTARLRARGRVRWTRNLGRDGHGLAGICFERILTCYGDRLRFVAPPRPETRGPSGRDPQRHFPRFSPPADAVARLPRGFWRTLGLSTNAARRLTDLSLGGTHLVCGRPLTPGRRVDLVVDLRRPAARLEAAGEVRWCRRDTLSLEPRWHVGVAFRELPPLSRAHLVTAEKLFLGF
jgi:hypothetical protein